MLRITGLAADVEAAEKVYGNMDKRIMIIQLLWLLGLSGYDIRYKRVPVWLVLLGGVAAAGSGIFQWVCLEGSPADFFMGMIPGAVLLLLALGTQKAGWADGVVLMFLGSVLGFRQCILAVMFSFILISVVSAVLMILKKVDKGTAVAYVPFLTIGFVLCEMIRGG